MADITIRARCYPTEDKERVSHAIKNVFPDAVVEGEDLITAHSNSSDTFVELLRRQRIRDAARAVLRRALARGESTFAINKQVASVGKISFAEESHALGDIEITMAHDELKALVDSLAPEVRKGAGT